MTNLIVECITQKTTYTMACVIKRCLIRYGINGPEWFIIQIYNYLFKLSIFLILNFSIVSKFEIINSESIINS